MAGGVDGKAPGTFPDVPVWFPVRFQARIRLVLGRRTGAAHGNWQREPRADRCETRAALKKVPLIRAGFQSKHAAMDPFRGPTREDPCVNKLKAGTN